MATKDLALVLANVVHRDHVWMRELGHGLGFALQACRRHVQVLALGTQQLERDLSVQLGIVGGVDHSHPALAQHVQNDVPSDRGPARGRRAGGRRTARVRGRAAPRRRVFGEYGRRFLGVGDEGLVRTAGHRANIATSTRCRADLRGQSPNETLQDAVSGPREDVELLAAWREGGRTGGGTSWSAATSAASIASFGARSMATSTISCSRLSWPAWKDIVAFELREAFGLTCWASPDISFSTSCAASVVRTWTSRPSSVASSLSSRSRARRVGLRRSERNNASCRWPCVAFRWICRSPLSSFTGKRCRPRTSPRVLELPRGTVKTRLMRGRKRLAELVDELAGSAELAGATLSDIARWATDLRALAEPGADEKKDR